MVPEQVISPNEDVIKSHLRHITRRWSEVDDGFQLELRFLTPQDPAVIKNIARFHTDENGIAEAAQHAAAMNQHKLNAYVVVNPIKADVVIEPGKAAKDDDIACSFFHWADADDGQAAQNIKDFVGPRPTFVVLTGTQPCNRPHVYWELEEPAYDRPAWRTTQEGIAARLGTDPSVVNPSRIMRIGGSINWPTPKKREKGYITELSDLHIHDKSERPHVSSERLARAFSRAGAAANATNTSCKISANEAYPSLDRALAAANILAGTDWRENLKKLVASYIARGWSDDEIIARCLPFTLPGWTQEQTRDDVVAFIIWTRQQEAKKGGKFAESPDQAVAPNSQGTRPPFDTTPLSKDDLRGIKPREWLYGYKLIRGFCSVVVSPGGTGKSAWVAAIAADMAEHRNTLHDAPHGPLKSWIYNLEDPRDETLRKLAALDAAKGISTDALSRVIVNSGRDRSLIVAEEKERGVYVAAPDVDLLIREMREKSIDVLIVDPAVRAHRLPENDNKAIDLMMDQFARVAHEANASVLLVHHTRKGFVAGEMDSMRGASAMGSAARVAFTLQTMTSEEGVDMNIPEAERRSYVRVDNAKANLSPPPLGAEWLKLESQNIGNATEDYPDGDFVQVVTKWAPPDPWADVGELLPEIIARIERGFVHEDGSFEAYSPAKKAGDRYVANAVLASFPDGSKSEKQCMAVIRHWLDKGILRQFEYTNQKGNTRKGIEVVNGGNVDE